MSIQTDVSRRQFLRGDIAGRAVVIRPPWAAEEAAFVSSCTRCDACMNHCAERLIKRGSGGLPELDFTAGMCTFCGDCLQHCPTDALVSARPSAHWREGLAVEANCLAVNGVDCRVCADQCDASAIRFIPVLRSVSRPHLEMDRCTGCGACIAPCPAEALRFSPINNQGNQPA